MLPSNWNVHAANDDGSSDLKLQIQEAESTVLETAANKGIEETPLLLGVQDNIGKFPEGAIAPMTGCNIIRS